MRKILIAGLGALVALAGAVLVVPSFIDWNAYKDEIARRISAATGRAVELKGSVGLALLPAPALTVRDARLANPPGTSSPDMAWLKQLDVRVSPGALLRGVLQVESVTLVEPTFVVEVLPDGRVNWDLSAGGAEGGPERPPSGGLFSDVSFDRVTIENGTILYRDARSGRSEQIDRLDARVVAGSLGGPFQAQGSFVLHGIPLQGELTTGRFTEGAAVPVRAALHMADGDDADTDPDASLRFAGIVTSGPNGGTRAQGDLRAEAPDFSRLAQPLRLGSGGALGALVGPVPASAFGRPFSLRAAIEASRQEATFSNLEVQFGDTRASGKASVKPGTPARAEVALAINRLDLDALLDRGAPPPKPQPAPPSRGGATARPPEAGGFSLPGGLDARINLSVDGITYNGGLVRQGRIEAGLGEGVLSIDRASALLPGGADIVGAGSLTAVNGQPNLDLRVEANADDLRGVLQWLKLGAGSVPADRLRRAALAGTVQGRPGRVDLTDLDLQVDSSRITGALTWLNRERPAIGARLRLDRLNLDAYLAQPGGTAVAVPPPAPGPGPGKAAEGAASPVSTASLLSRFDANLDLTAEQLTVRGLPAQDLHVEASVVGGAVTLREATVADLAGIKARASGTAAAVEPLRDMTLTLEAEAASLAGLSRALPWPAPAPAPDRLGPVAARARLGGDAGRMTVELALDGAGGTLEAGGVLTELEEDAAADLKLRARHPDAARLAALLGGGAEAEAAGPLDVYGELSGTRRSLLLNNIQGLVAGTSLRGQAGASFEGERPAVEAELQADSIALDRLLAAPAAVSRPASGAGAPAAAGSGAGGPLDLSWLRGFDGRFGLTAGALTLGENRVEDATLRAALADGALTLERFDGGLLGGRIGLTGRLAAPTADGAQLPAAAASITLSGAQFGSAGALPETLWWAAPVSSGRFDLEMALETRGASTGAMLQALSGEGRVAGRDGVLRGFDLAALRDRLAGRLERSQDALEAALRGFQGGETAFTRLDGSFTLERGVMRSEEMRVVTEAGDATASGQVDLPTRTVDIRLRVEAKAETELPPLTLRLTGPLDTPTRAFELREVQEFLARRAAAAKP